MLKTRAKIDWSGGGCKTRRLVGRKSDFARPTSRLTTRLDTPRNGPRQSEAARVSARPGLSPLAKVPSRAEIFRPAGAGHKNSYFTPKKPSGLRVGNM